MARPYKTGLDYFDLDCYVDDKIKMIQAEFGLVGFAVVVKLFQVIYREQGYYCEWSDDKAVLFACDECSNCGVNTLKEIVGACIRRGIFSEEIFEKYGILTSRGIQKRYFNAVSRRKEIEVEKDYLLVEISHNSIKVGKNENNDDKNSIDSCKSTQSREEKSREENNKPAAPLMSAETTAPQDDCDDGFMSPEEALRRANSSET